MRDRKIQKLITQETARQENTLNLIASENYVSRDVREALGSQFTNKYAEGYSSLRYYGGNEVVDALENLVQERALRLFHLSEKEWRVNVQAYSGSSANLAVLLALVLRGEKIMGMALAMGGHLTHGHKASITGKLWQQIPYGVNQNTETLDYVTIEKLARQERPKLIISGGSAYSHIIHFQKIAKIARVTNSLHMVDMSHFSGLVAGGVYPSPFPYADIITTTTHKTLRGPRAALIFSRIGFSKQIDAMVFPGMQGGPHANTITAVGVALHEASTLSFKKYARQVIKNAKMLAEELQKNGWRIVSGGTTTHLFLVDTMARGISGKTAGELLERAGIIVNKNMIPFDTRTPHDPSGIRLGTPALTTRGMKEKEMKIIASLLHTILTEKKSSPIIRNTIAHLCKKFPCSW